MLALLLEQREENRRLSTFLKAKIPDIKKFFPIQNNQILQQFMDESDGLFPLRRSEFYNFVSSCASDKKNLFATTLLNNCFSDEYIANHVWPTHRYINYFFY